MAGTISSLSHLLWFLKLLKCLLVLFLKCVHSWIFFFVNNIIIKVFIPGKFLIIQYLMGAAPFGIVPNHLQTVSTGNVVGLFHSVSILQHVWQISWLDPRVRDLPSTEHLPTSHPKSPRTVTNQARYCRHVGGIQYLTWHTTSDFSEKIPSLRHSGASHFTGNLIWSWSALLWRKYSLEGSMVSERPKSATLMTKLKSILFYRKM